MSSLIDTPPNARAALPLQTPLCSEERAALNALSGYLTPERAARFADVLRFRTQHLTIVLDSLRQRHNYSAVLRSADAFGAQTVHVIDPDAMFDISRNVAMGAHKWLRIEQSETTADCFNRLRTDGFRIVATSPHPPTTPLADLDLSKPTALVFGNELEGLSDEVAAAADERVAIPTNGFVRELERLGCRRRLPSHAHHETAGIGRTLAINRQRTRAAAVGLDPTNG